jgi:DUF2934 family protein
MQSNKTSSKKTRKNAETSNAVPEITSTAQQTPTPKSRVTRSSTVKKSETSETVSAKRHRKASSPSPTESTTATKTMAAPAVVVEVASSPVPAVAVPEPTAVVINEVMNEAPVQPQVTHEAIAQLAYSYWVTRGYRHGFTEEDWYRAESELKSRR